MNILPEDSGARNDLSRADEHQDADPSLRRDAWAADSGSFPMPDEDWDAGGEEISYPLLDPTIDPEYAGLYDCDPFDTDPVRSVQDWEIVAFGNRPRDHMVRDCLFASLFRDRRATMFHTYARRPSQWMESAAAHLPSDDRPKAHQFLALHLLHKRHLARLLMIPAHDEDARIYDVLRRIWCCPPVGALMRHRGGTLPPVCGLARHCPWCFARKVVSLHRVLGRALLADPKGKYLLLGKAEPFAEPEGGLEGECSAQDWRERMSSPRVFKRGGWCNACYYGRDPARILHRRGQLMAALADNATWRLAGGLVFHQLGSSQGENGSRTFLHDLAVLGVVEGDFVERRAAEDGDPQWGTRSVAVIEGTRVGFNVNWFSFLAADPQALRTALAGCSLGYPAPSLVMGRDLHNWRGYPEGLNGALSWQPTFLLDDHMSTAYFPATRKQPLYRPFGSWAERFRQEVAAERETTSQKFQRLQQGYRAKRGQQKGNRARQRTAEDRRTKLLQAAQDVWPAVLAEPAPARGRPAHRKHLKERLDALGLSVSQRDLAWVMQSLQPGAVAEQT
jgi:hypothetical protein